MGTKVTIQDIADELGLSRNTVSKALNNAPGLSQATRERIIQKAMEMGYKHFALAHVMASTLGGESSALPNIPPDSPREIAVLSAMFLGGSHFASLTLDAFQDKASQLGFMLGMHRVSEAHIEQLKLPITFRREHVAGIICFEMFDRNYVEMLCQLGLPILFVDGPAPLGGYSIPADLLCMENYSGITQLVDKALAAGKTRIGFVGDHTHCRSFYERYAAFLLAMQMAGQPVEDSLCIPYIDLDDIGPRIEALDAMPDLFLCANDFVALQVLQAVRGLGYDVPRDVWLAGFDDSPESRTCMPPLTTVHIHTQIIAFAAIELLRNRAEQPSLDYVKVYTDTDLIIRESTPFK